MVGDALFIAFFIFIFFVGTMQVTGWAYARGAHKTKEHILVYWLAPIEGTLLAVWIFKLLFKKPKENLDVKAKSE